MDTKPQHIKEQDAGLIDKFSKHPQKNFFNHPVILKSTVSGALLAGLLAAVIAWLLSAGVLGTEEPIKITSINPVGFAFIGFIAGSAVGGLVGYVYGIFLMLKEKW